MRWIWAGFGFLFLGLGAIGIVVPLWPTTIFWILAVLCLSESHPGIRDWIYRRPGIGRLIEGFIERQELSRAGKTTALFGIVFAGVISSYILRDILWAVFSLWTLLSIVAVFVITRKRPQSD